MATKAKFLRRCAELGVKPDIESGERYSFSVPVGYRTVDGQLHWHDIYNSPPGAWTASEAYDEMMHILSDGIERCPEDEAGICGVCEDSRG